MELMVFTLLAFFILVGMTYLRNAFYDFQAWDVDNYQLIKIIKKEKMK
jgi:hypothetical protein